ncbi:MAG: hypothetical protein WB698_03070 [Solirubrobacteraceae bacterium]
MLATVGASLLLIALGTAASASAATIYACQKKKGGTIRIVSAKTKCNKKTEKKISWNTEGPAGKNGSNGANGANGKEGAAGQPQKAVKFSASEENTGSPTPIALFSADGINYTFMCQNVIFFDDALLDAAGSAGQSYALGNFGRPSGIAELSSDLKSEVQVATIGSSPTSIATTPSAATSEGSIEHYGVWTITVEGPTSTTWIHAWFDTTATCKIHGTAITVPN